MNSAKMHPTDHMSTAVEYSCGDGGPTKEGEGGGREGGGSEGRKGGRKGGRKERETEREGRKSSIATLK